MASAAERTANRRPDPPRADSLVAYQRARRERIVLSSVQLMLEHDYASVQMKDVSAQAGVALGTMYRYFRSKDHLFAEALLSWSERFGRETDAPEGSSVERLKVGYRRAARAFERYPHVYSYLLALQGTTDPLALEVFEKFAARQSEAFASFLPRIPSPRREQIVAVMSAVLDANLRNATWGRSPMAAVYAAIDDAAELLLG